MAGDLYRVVVHMQMRDLRRVNSFCTPTRRTMLIFFAMCVIPTGHVKDR